MKIKYAIMVSVAIIWIMLSAVIASAIGLRGDSFYIIYIFHFAVMAAHLSLAYYYLFVFAGKFPKIIFVNVFFAVLYIVVTAALIKKGAFAYLPRWFSGYTVAVVIVYSILDRFIKAPHFYEPEGKFSNNGKYKLRVHSDKNMTNGKDAVKYREKYGGYTSSSEENSGSKQKE